MKTVSVLILLALLCATPAYAAYPDWVLAIRDCASNGRLDRHYSRSALQKALHEIPADGGEYTACAEAIRAAYEGGTGRPEGPPPAGIVTESGAVAGSDADVAALQEVMAAASRDEAPQPVHLGARDIAPPPSPVSSLSAIRHWNELPTPLAACLGAAALLGAISTATALADARRRAG
jgi:hypothetical protein